MAVLGIIFFVFYTSVLSVLLYINLLSRVYQGNIDFWAEFIPFTELEYRVQISFRLAGYFCVQSLTLFFAICPHVTLLLTFTEVLVDIFKFFEYTISWLIDLETFPPLFYFYHTFLLKTAASTLILPLRVTHVKMFLNETV